MYEGVMPPRRTPEQRRVPLVRVRTTFSRAPRGRLLSPSPPRPLRGSLGRCLPPAPRHTLIAGV